LRCTLLTSDHLCAQVVVDDAHAALPFIGGAVLRSVRAAALFLDGVAEGVPPETSCRRAMLVLGRSP
jgi:hypothetical protein